MKLTKQMLQPIHKKGKSKQRLLVRSKRDEIDELQQKRDFDSFLKKFRNAYHKTMTITKILTRIMIVAMLLSIVGGDRPIGHGLTVIWMCCLLALAIIILYELLKAAWK